MYSLILKEPLRRGLFRSDVYLLEGGIAFVESM